MRISISIVYSNFKETLEGVHSKVLQWNSVMEWINLQPNLNNCGAGVRVLNIDSSSYSLSVKERKEGIYLIPLGKDPTIHVF